MTETSHLSLLSPSRFSITNLPISEGLEGKKDVGCKLRMLDTNQDELILFKQRYVIIFDVTHFRNNGNERDKIRNEKLNES